MKPIAGAVDLREADRRALKGRPEDALVRRAGFAVALAGHRMLEGRPGRRVVVLAGPGHNGDDGRVAAGWLRRFGEQVAVVDVVPNRGRPFAWPELPSADLVVDAVFGIGFRGEWAGPSLPSTTRVLAVDLPSGLDTDTGAAGEQVLVADLTVTMTALKPGLLLGRGPEVAGQVELVDIGVPAPLTSCALLEAADLARLPSRPTNAHKWTTAVCVVAGSPGMLGAAQLVTGAAARAGAGMVRLAVPGLAPERLPAGDAVAIPVGREGWADALDAELARVRACAVGPGLGRGEAVAREVRRLLLHYSGPVVIDADALGAIGSPEEVASLGEPARLVLTPHDGEYRGLVGRLPGADRVAAARELARRAGAVVLLKGPTTVVAEAGGAVRLVRAGDPRLATAGSGDVLTGIVVALLASGLPPFEAASLGALLHAEAARRGPAAGLVASDLPGLVAATRSEALRAAAGKPGVAAVTPSSPPSTRTRSVAEAEG